MEFLHPAMWLWDHNTEFTGGSRPTPQSDTWLWDDVIEFARWQHPAMWHVALEL